MTKEALKLALEALEYRGVGSWRKKQPAITAIKEALAQPEHCSDCGQKLGDANHIHTCSPQLKQEPVAWVCMKSEMHDIDFDQPEIDAIPVGTMLYTTPPQRTWVGLTHEERKLVRNSVGFNQFMTVSEYAENVQKATEAKLRSKNT